jgi:serralysin
MGDDTLIGGAGSDTASYAHSDADIQVRLNTTSVQNTFGAGNDKLVSIENLIGGSGDNIFTGSSGANVLDGGAGNDQLSGGGGTDTLIGGLGQDKLTGGSGADIFRFESVLDSLGGARDRIMDFTRGSDKIDLSEIDAISGTTENDSFRFVGTNAFSGAAGELRFFKSGTTTIVEADVNGDRIADFQIEVANSVTPTASDFLL